MDRDGRTRGGARRPIPFEELAEVQDRRVREVVGAEWLERMKQEHLAVGAFALLTSELAADGCEPVVLSLAARAVEDEVRHTEVCRRIAASFLGEAAVPAGFRGLPKVPEHADAHPSQRVLFHVVEMCCLSETFTGVYFSEALGRTTHPAMRIAIESLLEDEIDHGRVGWAYLASRARDGRTRGLADALPDMIDRVLGRVAQRGRSAPEPEAAEVALGTLGHRESARLFARALANVVLPGFERLAVDLGPALERIRLRGWVDGA